MKTRRQQGILTGMPFMANLAPRTFLDALGRKIYLPQVPERVVSLAPSVTEMLYALGAEDRLVAVTEFCNYPPAARQKPRLSGTRPGIETLVSHRPDLVLTPTAFVEPSVLAKLDQLKITTYVLDAKSVEEILSDILTIGRMFNRVPQATELVSGLRARIHAVKARTQDVVRPRVLYVLNSDPFVTVGPGSFIHQLIELAGGMNVGGLGRHAYPRLSLETVLRERPEVILFPVGDSEGIPPAEQERWQRWKELPAIVHDRLYRIDSELLDRPGPRIVEGLEQLARLLHPDAFGSPRP